MICSFEKAEELITGNCNLQQNWIWPDHLLW